MSGRKLNSLELKIHQTALSDPQKACIYLQTHTLDIDVFAVDFDFEGTGSARS